MLAHEIKNPLSGIRGAAQLLEGGEGAADLTSLIVTEVDRIAALIDGMQDFSDTTPLELTSENIYPLLDHARRVARAGRSEEHTSELQSLMRISYAVFCLKKKKNRVDNRDMN